MRTVSLFASVFLIVVLLFSTDAVQASQSSAWSLIRGSAFDDLDKDGIREIGEHPLPGTVICLVGYVVPWCDHTEWGEYEFDQLPPGTYQVELTQWPDGYFLLSPNPVTVTVPEGEVVMIVHFALSNDPEGVIRGMAFVDADGDGLRDPLEQGLDGVQVCLVGYNRCNYTENGQYEFDLLPPGDYTVRLRQFPKRYHLTTPKTINLTLGDAEIRSDVDFGLQKDQRRIK